MKGLINIDSKKGINLLNFTFGLMIAALCIFLLLFASNKIYGGVREQRALQQAEGHMRGIEAVIDGLIADGGGEAEYDLYSPKGWVLIGWPLLNRGEILNPERCKDYENCLCICYYANTRWDKLKGHGVVASAESFKDLCDSPRAVCIEVIQKDLEVNPQVGVVTSIYSWLIDSDMKKTPIFISKLLDENLKVEFKLVDDKLLVLEK